jgi:acyl transferase domain-containing protein
VNLLLDEVFTANMRNSGFLSHDNRCKAFDDTANGYVRAEGGGLVLLANEQLIDKHYATVAGSAVNQNGARSQVITAPHPEAQEELITSACQDAGVKPQEIAYIECHGTGTRIGDPIEISAIQNTIAKNRQDTCYIGSVKSNIGHLESAAGIAGLIKSIAILNHGKIPPNLHFTQPNQYIDFETHHIRVVTEETAIDHQAAIGVSSFGFGGTNAHIIVKGAEAAVRKTIKPIEIPFDRENAVSIDSYLRRLGSNEAEIDAQSNVNDHESDIDAITREKIDQLLGDLFFQLTSIEEIDPDIELIDQGLDSMSGTELLSQLGSTLNIEIEPDLVFEYPLRDQLVDELFSRTCAKLDN